MKIRLAMPKRYLEILKEYISLSKEQKDNYLQLISSITPGLSKNEINDLINLSKEEYEKILEYLRLFIAIYMHMIRYRKPENAFVDEVIEKSAKRNEIELGPIEEIRDLTKKIKGMDENIGIYAKSIDLFTENQFIFFDARIITDLRHLFYNDIERIPNYAIIQHILRLSYSRNNKIREIFLNLDLDQLKELKKVIERAITKENTIMKLCKDKDTIILKEVEWY